MKLVITLTQDSNAVVSQVVRPITAANLPRVLAALRDRLVDPAGPVTTDVEVFQLWANDVVKRLQMDVQRYEAVLTQPPADAIG